LRRIGGPLGEGGWRRGDVLEKSMDGSVPVERRPTRSGSRPSATCDGGRRRAMRALLLPATTERRWRTKRSSRKMPALPRQVEVVVGSRGRRLRSGKVCWLLVAGCWLEDNSGDEAVEARGGAE